MGDPAVGPLVDVVLPVLNEAEALPWVLGRMPEGYRAIVVDNGSTDSSAEVARRFGVEVVTEPRPGFGAACFAGLTRAERDVVAFMDADASLDPQQLPLVVEGVVAGAADLVLGARAAEPGAWPAVPRLANRFLCRELGRRGGPRLRDLGPMRAAHRATASSVSANAASASSAAWAAVHGGHNRVLTRPGTGSFATTSTCRSLTAAPCPCRARSLRCLGPCR